MKIIFIRRCPVCGSKDTVRILGFSWKEKLPSVHKFECNNCNSQYLRILRIFYHILMYGNFIPKQKIDEILEKNDEFDKIKHNIKAGDVDDDTRFEILQYLNQKVKAKRRKRRLVINIFSLTLIALSLFFIIFTFRTEILDFFQPENISEINFSRQNGSIEINNQDTIETVIEEPVESPKTEKQKMIEDLLLKARNQIVKNQLTKPPGDNAWDTYQRVLLLDDGWNAEAAAGLQLIKEKLADLKKQEQSQEKLQKQTKQAVNNYLEKREELLAKERKEKLAEKQAQAEKKELVEKRKKEQVEALEEKKQQKMYHDFWLAIDWRWEKIFNKQVNKNKIIESDIPYLINLQRLDCSNSDITHLEPIKYMKKLNYLDCSRTDIKDIQPLSNLNSLEYLDLSYTNISNLFMIEKLTNLKTLICANTSIDNLSPLRDLTNLEKLDISFTQIEQLKDIAKLINMKELNCNETEIQSISKIRDMEKLEILKLHSTQLEKLVAANLYSLKILDISETNVEGVEDLVHSNRLINFNCSQTNISELDALENHKQLEVLNCSDTQINDLYFLRDLTDLEILNCSNTLITSLKPISNLTNLEKLICNNTYVSTFERKHYENLVNLKELIVDKNIFIGKFEEVHPDCRVIRP